MSYETDIKQSILKAEISCEDSLLPCGMSLGKVISMQSLTGSRISRGYVQNVLDIFFI